MKDVYIVRHGETLDNRNDIIQGQADSSLTKEGKNSIRERARKLKNIDFDIIYCSPLGRAKSSLDIILEEARLKATISYVKEIMELDFGRLSKRAVKDVKDIIIKHKQNTKIPYPGGESGDMLKKRVIWFMENYILGSVARYFLVITHYGVLETILRHYVGLPNSDIRANMDGIAKLSFNGKEVESRWIR